MADNGRIAKINFDENSAICDIGPYDLYLSVVEDRLKFDVRSESNEKIVEFSLRSNSLKRIIKDYFLICESYFEAIKIKTPSQIEVIDMGRRGIHNEGAELLRDRLSSWVEVDKATARRLFTLFCVLHIRG